MTSPASLDRIDDDRRSRLRDLAAPALERVQRDLSAKLPDREDVRASTTEGIAFARSLEYHHEGQDAETYLMHPMRVASLYVDYATPVDPWGVALALIHNVLEVATVEPAAVAAHFGEAMYDALVTLTVDRERQWDPVYKQSYYAAIRASAPAVGAIKVLDKLDNLYLLPLNADDDVRARYLDEIERWVLPLARARVPGSAPLIDALVRENRAIGHRPLNAWNLE